MVGLFRRVIRSDIDECREIQLLERHRVVLMCFHMLDSDFQLAESERVNETCRGAPGGPRGATDRFAMGNGESQRFDCGVEARDARLAVSEYDTRAVVVQ